MKKMNFSKKLATTLFVIALSATTLGVATLNASAEEFSIDNVSLSMYEGAYVRMPDETYEKGGLRYTMEMSVSDYETLMENVGEGKKYSSVEFGIFVAPNYYDAWNALSEESNIVGESAVYGWLTEEEKQADTAWANSVAGQNGLIQIINTQDPKLTNGTNSDNEAVKVFNGSVVDMYQNNMLLEYIGVGYIRYTDTTGTHYKFATANDNARSMTYVAQCAIENGADTSGALHTTYVAPFAASETTYTVDYYFRNAMGEYVKDETVKASDTVASTVGATVTPAKELDGYTAVTTNNEKGTVFANGKSSFALYYRAETNLYDFEADEAVVTGFGGNVAGEEKISIVAAPEREGDTALCMEDTGTASTAYLLLPANISKSGVSAYTDYNMINFDIYVDAASNVAFYPYLSGTTGTGLTNTLINKKWVTYSIPLNLIAVNGNANYLRFWNGTIGYKVYISNVTLSNWNGVVTDYDNTFFNGINVTASGLNATNCAVSVADDPVTSGTHGKVLDLKWKAAQWNAEAKFTNIDVLVAIAKSCGFDLLEVDVYSTFTSGNISFHMNKWSISSGAQQNAWTTVRIPLDTAAASSPIAWAGVAGDFYIDNIRFTKWSDVFSETRNVFPLRSTHASNPSVSIVEDPTNSGKGTVYAYTYTASIYDQYIYIDGLAALVTEAQGKGYTKLTMDVYRTTGNATVQILGQSFKPTAKNAWQTISVDLSSLTGTNLFWLSEAGSIYLDNVCFTK